ncbi:hypothetical protein [Rugamonas rivuli]|uniref:Uncharacterized protein n=1 Tax=Rugamonas rivuli TaxID=2743358 RepID=A0A843S3V5_9BURK|nr:hypothetical protein [Rugamonas rivuli]MQA18809.1 hypothetical protein [Rugamonas rivuli]
MKWGKLDGIEPKNYLLYMVLMWVVAPYDNRPVDHFLKRVIGDERGFGGDPGWEIEYVTDISGSDNFRVWADKNVSGLCDEETMYDTATFHAAVRETLLAYAIAHPHRAVEVAEIIKTRWD